MIRGIIKGTLFLGVLGLAAVLVAGSALPARAALPPPSWLPGQPMLAGTQVIAMWLPVPGAVKYIVYINGEKAMETPSNQFFAVAPEAGGEYNYEVAAVDATGAEGTRSSKGLIRVTVISPPTDLLVRTQPETKSASIRWKIPPGSVISNVYRSEKKEGPFSLLGSVQGDTYKDSNLEVGKEYFYHITAKDISGKESGKSDVVSLVLEEVVVQEEFKIEMVIKTTKTLETRLALGGIDIPEIKSLRKTPQGNLLLSLEDATVVLLSAPPALNELARYDLRALHEEKGLTWRVAIDLLPLEDGFIASDTHSGNIARVDGKGRLLWSVPPKHPPDDEAHKKIWDSAGRRVLTEKIPPGPLALFLKDADTLWAGDARMNLVYVMDPDTGETRDWWNALKRVDAKGGESSTNFSVFSTFFRAAPDLVIATEPFTHIAYAFNPDTLRIQYVLGEKKEGYKGGFLMPNEVHIVPKDGKMLVLDSGLGTLQVFDPKDGAYLYHIGGEKTELDPALNNERPKMDMGAFLNGFFEDATGNLWVMDNRAKQLYILKINW